MKKLSGAETAEVLGGCILWGSGEISFSGVSTDTRSISPGDLFIPLAGENYDAHDFIGEALEKGAAGVLTSRDLTPEQIPGKPACIIKVGNTLTALQQLAAYNRRQFRLPVVGITGSNGKTTTKDMIAAVLSQKFKTLKTQGNLNNQIGLPLTILKLDETYQAMVVEMGMSSLGEIHRLAATAKPDIGVITTIGESHLEMLGSMENIAQAKGELLDHLSPQGLAVLNGDDPRIRKIRNRFPGRAVFYGLGDANHIQAKEVVPTAEGMIFKAGLHFPGRESTEILIHLPVMGRHNVLNSLAAIAVGWELGLPAEAIKKGLEGLVLTGMRLEIIESQGLKIINDAYNASPASMKAALKTLKDISGKRRTIAVLGNMFELGQREREGHMEVGQAAAELGIDCMVTVGQLAGLAAAEAEKAGMKAGAIFKCTDTPEAVDRLKALVGEGDVILVKGSRGMRMEEIISGLLKTL